jgi:2-polyprenyl-3-methyl-5-hydroxy-6-metoxy-1,4-benzoquinol methylase
MKVCPICQSTRRFIPYAKFGDVNLRRCRNCDSITTSNRPTQLQAFSLHNNSDYFKHSYFCKRRNNIHYWKKLTKNIVQLAHAAKPFFSLSNQNHMDIGCDTGGLLKSFSKMYNTIPFGVDVSKAAIDYLSQNKINHFYGCLEDLKIPQTFKLITAVDVIEHIAEPLNLFKSVRKFLAHDGFFYFETPNTSSWIYRIGVLLNRLRLPFLKVYLERLFPPEHLQYY